MEWIPGERRKRGRPRKTWMEGVRAAMKTRHLEEDQWLNRKEWCLGSGRRRRLSQDRKDRETATDNSTGTYIIHYSIELIAFSAEYTSTLLNNCNFNLVYRYSLSVNLTLPITV